MGNFPELSVFHEIFHPYFLPKKYDINSWFHLVSNLVEPLMVTMDILGKSEYK